MDSANSAIDEEMLEKEAKELGEYAEKQYRYNAFWRPVVGGLLFGLGGAVIIVAAVFGWTYHLLGHGFLTMFFAIVIGFTMLYLGIGLTS